MNVMGLNDFDVMGLNDFALQNPITSMGTITSDIR